MTSPVIYASNSAAVNYVAPAPVTASQLSDDGRTFTGLVLPFGKVGRTSAGKLTVAADSVALPKDISRVKIYRDHSNAGGVPVGKAISAEVTDEGIYMSFRLGATPDGEAAKADIVEGIRDALSVELVDATHHHGILTAANLSAVALVSIPAFDDARVKHQPTTATAASSGPSLAARVSPQIITAGSKATGLTLGAAATAITARIHGTNDESVTAALSQITEAANASATNSEWLGELFTTAPFEREIVPTLSNHALRSMKLESWRWVTRPKVDNYAGNLQEIPSNSIQTEPVSVDAKRIAGGHKIDRKYIDFADSEFITSYLREMAASYKRKTDEEAAKFLKTEAAKNKVSGTQPDLLRAAGKARQVIRKAVRLDPTSYLVNPDDMFELLNVTIMDQPQYLDLLGVDPKQFISDETVKKGTVIAYHKDAIHWGELPGSPIRVSAEDIAHGGSDHALFGYWAALVRDPRALVEVSFKKPGDM